MSTGEGSQKISVLSSGSALSSDTNSSRADGAYEQFWNVKDPFLLAKKVMDKSTARKYFRFEALYKDFYCKTNESVRVDEKDKDHRRKIIKGLAQKKSLLNIIAEKDTKIIKIKIMRKLIRRKIRETKPISLEDSVMIWMHCSRAVDMMRDSQGYYKRLLDQHYVDYFHHQITQVTLDVKRSTTLVSDPKHLECLQRIFVAYARRNACIGYCQGLNFIVAKFLSFKLAEEECFWLLSQLLENVLPLDYFPNMMMGVVCDLKIMESLLRKKSTKLYKKLQTFEANVLNILLTQWVVCLFTQVLDDSLLIIAWNWLFAKGSTAIFSVCLVMLDYCESDILKAKNLEVVKTVEKQLREWKDTKKFTKKLKKVYINEKGINFMRELYKQICILELEQRQQARMRRQSEARTGGNMFHQPFLKCSKVDCDPKLPICHELMARENQRNSSSLPPDFFVFKTQRQFEIQHDYFHAKKTTDKRNVGLDSTDILQSIQDHVCVFSQPHQLLISDIIKPSLQIDQQNLSQSTGFEQDSQKQISPQSRNPSNNKNEQISERVSSNNTGDFNPRTDSQLREAEEIKAEEFDDVGELNDVKNEFVSMQRDSTGSDTENVDEHLDNSKSFKFFANISKSKNNYRYLVPGRRKTINFSEELFQLEEEEDVQDLKQWQQKQSQILL